MTFDMAVPCLLGVEGLVSDELKRMGMKNVHSENGRVLFSGEKQDIAKANISVRYGERVLLCVGDGRARTFDELFETVKAMPWENFIPVKGAFPVKGHSLNSALYSVPDCQKIIKKAIVERLKLKYKTDWFEESGGKYQVQFSIMKDTAHLYIDTSGSPLHKRGYRPVGNAAPLRETLAAAMVGVSRFKGREAFYDPFCGSGTIPIEAALAAVNRAPGINRSFAAESFIWLDRKVWQSARQEATDNEYRGPYEIFGGDVDPECIEISRRNAVRAGVERHIRFEVSDARHFRPKTESGIIVTNPPYGERVMERRQAEELYGAFGKAVLGLNDFKMYILSSHTEFERTFGKTADKKRKLYNGMIKCDLFIYGGGRRR